MKVSIEKLIEVRGEKQEVKSKKEKVRGKKKYKFSPLPSYFSLLFSLPVNKY